MIDPAQVDDHPWAYRSTSHAGARSARNEGERSLARITDERDYIIRIGGNGNGSGHNAPDSCRLGIDRARLGVIPPRAPETSRWYVTGCH
jgi:hypothetical protein